jgi:starch synthase
MKLLIVSSEAVPYIKTGGLGDIAGTLSTELAHRKHQVRLILPLYRHIDRSKFILKAAIPALPVTMGDGILWCRVWEHERDAQLKVYFIEHNSFFDRPSIYGASNQAYFDNGQRFAFFSKAALELARKIDFKPDIVHANDWQTALVCYYLKTWHWDDAFFSNTASILTIHNIGYQGQTDRSFSHFIGLNWMQVRESEFEALGGINLLKGGIYYADQITTVSPTYAREILSEPGGNGLSPFLQRRRDDIIGILNGIDTTEWDPTSDCYLPANYSAQDLSGKAVCKEELQKLFTLTVDPDIPIFGVVSRMVTQKGLDLLKDCLPEVLTWHLQLVILGDGDPYFTDYFGNLPRFHPFKTGSYIGFEPQFAHLIEAGADFFLMPSRYEPCGLNQMFSLVYGTLPIVRATGGLNDTVENFNPVRNTGTGFVFHDISPEALKNTIGWALHTWYQRRDCYLKMQQRAMSRDFSWNHAVTAYEKAYRKARKRRRAWI